MEVRRVSDFSEIGRETWDALCGRSGTNTIFQTYEWHIAWWEAYGEESDLCLLAVEDDSELVGIAPMMLLQGTGGPRVLAFIGDYRSDYLDFIYDSSKPAVVQAIVNYLGMNVGDWGRIDLSEIPESSPTHQDLARAAGESGLHCAVLRRRPCPALVIKGNEAEVEKTANKKKLRYFKRYFEKKPGYTVRHLDACEEIETHIEGFFRQHIERWAGTPTPSIFLEDKSKVFYRKLLSTMCERGWITFSIIESEGAPVAYHFGFVYNNVFVLYKPTYNPLLARHSPGLVLLKELLELAVSRHYDEFDFTVGDEPYKRRFASKIKYNKSYSLLHTQGDLVALRLRTGLKKRLEGNPLGRRLLRSRKRFASRQLPRLRETVRRYGVIGWIRRAAGMLFRRFVFRHSRVLFFEMPEGLIAAHPIEPKVKDVIFREASLSDLVRFNFPESPVLKREFLSAWRKSLEEGDRCFIAEIGGEVAATIWIRTRDYTYISEAETHVLLEDSPVCFFDAWTLPKFRGQRLLTFLYSKVLELYRDKRKVAYLYEANVGSLRAALALGNFRLVRIYYFLNVLGVKRRWSKPYTGPQPKL